MDLMVICLKKLLFRLFRLANVIKHSKAKEEARTFSINIKRRMKFLA